MLWKYLPYATFDHSDQCIPQWCYKNTSLILHLIILISVYHSDVKIPPLCYIRSFWSVYTSDVMKIPPLCYIWSFWSVYHSDVMKIPPYATTDCSDQCIPEWCYKNTSLMLHMIIQISVYHSDVMKIPPYATMYRSDQCIPEWSYENTSLCYIWSFWSV